MLSLIPGIRHNNQLISQKSAVTLQTPSFYSRHFENKMTHSSKFLVFFIFQISATYAQSQEQQNYYVEAFQQEGDSEALVLKIKPVPVDGVTPRFQILSEALQSRQGDEDDDDDGPVTTPFIPQIIPGLTKIFNGLVTGNLNMIFHGATSFAPKNVSYDINTVYNQVVGIPPPRTTIRTTTVPGAVVPNVAGVNGTAPAAKPVAKPAPTDEDEDGDGDDGRRIISRVRKFFAN